MNCRVLSGSNSVHGVGGGKWGAPGMWTWVSGSSSTNQAGNYGTQGVVASTNVPGAREESTTWRDSRDNLWVFGGSINGGNNYNDLWKFDGDSWVWKSGNNTANHQGTYGVITVSDPANVPGTRAGGCGWIDSSDNLWLMGGFGRDSASLTGELNDLWKYNTTTNEWTWMNGSNLRNQGGTYGVQTTYGIA